MLKKKWTIYGINLNTKRESAIFSHAIARLRRVHSTFLTEQSMPISVIEILWMRPWLVVGHSLAIEYFSVNSKKFKWRVDQKLFIIHI